MGIASLVLQYPDWQSGKIRLLATTKNKKALKVFKEVVLEEARLNALTADDPILKCEYETEARKLQQLLDLIVPDIDGEDDGQE